MCLHVSGKILLFYPPFDILVLITNQLGLKATSKRAQNTKKKAALPPWPTMEPEAAQDSDAPVARCPDAPIESTAPL